jgi:hypothetical protein
VTDNLVQTLELLKGATGVDLQQMMARAAGSTGSAVVPGSRPDGTVPATAAAGSNDGGNGGTGTV